jgi:carbonic anhydrase
MPRLIEGYRRFRRGRWPRLRALHEQLAAEGQNPHVMVITCADSRLDPTTIFDALPGQLFVVRNVANLVPPYEEKEGLHGTSAAIEFAVQKLGVDTILVLGHVACGGVAAALEPPEMHAGTFMGAWIDLLEEAKARIPNDSKDPHKALERESVRLSLERLRTFPFVARALQEKRLTLVGGVFGVADGALEMLDPATGKFMPALEPPPGRR